MPDEAQTSAASTASDELAVLNGGVEIDVEKIDGSFETVQVRQLPSALLPQWWNPDNQRDEAFIVELLCDKIDRTTQYNLANTRLMLIRVQSMLRSAPASQLNSLRDRLDKLVAEIEALEKKQRWSDTLTHESVAQIRSLGLRLNKKKAAEQMKRQAETSEEIVAEMKALGITNSSSPSQESAESSRDT
jgi:hypothetical protein